MMRAILRRGRRISWKRRSDGKAGDHFPGLFAVVAEQRASACPWGGATKAPALLFMVPSACLRRSAEQVAPKRQPARTGRRLPGGAVRRVSSGVSERQVGTNTALDVLNGSIDDGDRLRDKRRVK